MKSNTKKLKWGLFCAFLLLTGTTSMFAQDTIVAFPGAEGFGKYASGGRGGRVIEVTNLDDIGRTGVKAGSFRAAVGTSGTDPITIIFKVSGTIELDGELKSSRPNMTIAGQTAPGDGICFKNYSVKLSGRNLIVRYIRFRPGDEFGDSEPSCLNIENASQIIVDHCSMSWAVEENLGMYDNDSTTVQWCIISEGLYNSLDDKGARGYGTQWGGQWATMHHCLFAHNASRSPRFNGAHSNDYFAVQDFRNNVIYNYGSGGAIYGGETEISIDTNADGKNDASSRINFINNYLRPGPAYKSSIFITPSYNREDYVATGYSKWYFDGNVVEGYSNVTDDNWLGVSATNIPGGKDSIRADAPHSVEPVITQTADSAFDVVLANAGAILPIRDAVDIRIINDVVNKTGSIIDSQDEVGGWPELKTPVTDSIPADTDKDGIPDYWEDENGLNKLSADDGKIITSDGYSNLEHYLNSDIRYIDPYTGINNISGVSTIELYPNPVTNSFTVKGDVQINKVDIYSLNGSLLISKNITDSNRTIDLSSIENGLYIVKVISSNSTVFTQKIVKH